MFPSILIVFALILPTYAKTIPITVRGKFLCGRETKLPVYIELVDHDLFDDDILKWKVAYVKKMFEIQASKDVRFRLQPFLRVMHTCRGFRETMILEFGRLKDGLNIDIGDIDLGNPESKKELLYKFAKYYI